MEQRHQKSAHTARAMRVDGKLHDPIAQLQASHSSKKTDFTRSEINAMKVISRLSRLCSNSSSYKGMRYAGHWALHPTSGTSQVLQQPLFT
jgi:hypothetical protein